MNNIQKFIAENFKTIVLCAGFVIGLYVQFQANTEKINELESDIIKLNERVNDQYSKLDQIKLDKTVFEASMKQLSEMSEDIREIRTGMDTFIREQAKK